MFHANTLLLSRVHYSKTETLGKRGRPMGKHYSFCALHKVTVGKRGPSSIMKNPINVQEAEFSWIVSQCIKKHAFGWRKYVSKSQYLEWRSIHLLIGFAPTKRSQGQSKSSPTQVKCSVLNVLVFFKYQPKRQRFKGRKSLQCSDVQTNCDEGALWSRTQKYEKRKKRKKMQGVLAKSLKSLYLYRYFILNFWETLTMHAKNNLSSPRTTTETFSSDWRCFFRVSVWKWPSE